MSFNNGHFNASTTYNRSSGFTSTKIISALVDISASAVRGIKAIKSAPVNVTGAVVRSIAKFTSAATVDVTGSVLRNIGKITSNASVGATASIARGIGRLITGTVDVAATVPNRFVEMVKIISGIVGTIGTVPVRDITYAKVISAVVDVVGSAVRAVSSIKSGAVDATGSAIRAISSVKSATVDVTGSIARKTGKVTSSVTVGVISTVVRLSLIGKLFRISITSAKKVMSIISSGMKTEAVITSDDKIEGDL